MNRHTQKRKTAEKHWVGSTDDRQTNKKSDTEERRLDRQTDW